MLERDKDPATDYSAWYGHDYAGREDRPLKTIGIDHCYALMIPADSIDEMNEQIEWFAMDVMAQV